MPADATPERVRGGQPDAPRGDAQRGEANRGDQAQRPVPADATAERLRGRGKEDTEHRDKLARLRRLRELAVAKGQNERVAAIDELMRKEQDKHARRRAQNAEKDGRGDEKTRDQDRGDPGRGAGRGSDKKNG
ncbi:MAG: hypothetical protein EPO68_12925 [Planctomycetota bacterium]|nr:MAG: hypothetical protein EPO68_12925 [Planctomycetota bacterium]